MYVGAAILIRIAGFEVPACIARQANVTLKAASRLSVTQTRYQIVWPTICSAWSKVALLLSIHEP